MKKMIIAVMGVVCGAAIMMGVTVNHYQTKIANLENEVESLTDDYESLKSDNYYLSQRYDNLSSDKEELDSQVYNLMEGKNYEITIDHDGDSYTYTQKGKGLFKKTSKRIVNVGNVSID